MPAENPLPPDSPTLSRRNVLRAGTVAAAAGAAVTLDPLGFASADPGDSETQEITGRFDVGAPDWVYVPVEVPAGVSEIAVTYTYDKPDAPPGRPGNALDIGVFDHNGHDLGDKRGFRGWSGGFRDAFSISASEATPGYIPGVVSEGTWHVILGPYTVHPDGLNWTVKVTLTYGEPGEAFEPHPAPEQAEGRGRDWYRGDMHLHTVHSDGRWLPEELAAAARDAGLDFIVSTEHNTSSASGVWGLHASDDLLVVDGEEITTRNGHFVAAGLSPGNWIDWRYRSADGEIKNFLRDIHRDDAVAVAAHPYCPFVGCRWKFGYDDFDAVEVWNGPWTPDDEIALQHWDSMLVENAKKDKPWLPAVGNSDSHHDGQTVGLPQTAVLADDLSRASVLDAVVAGRAYVAESAEVSLEFTAAAGEETVGVGERLGDAGPEDEVEVRLAVAGASGATAYLHTDQGMVFEQALPADGVIAWTTRPQVATYVRAEVRRAPDNPVLPGPMVAFTNPIFLGDR
ncbi:MAG: CehA/McbA family metallohydrolase [Stackebrandtia sp.]